MRGTTLPVGVELTLSADLSGIPSLLKSVPQWICWRAGKQKPTGKFDKYPVDPATGKTHDAFNRKIWLSFKDACRLAQAKGFSGIGFVLTGEPVSHAEDGAPLYLIGLDIDEKSDLLFNGGLDLRYQWLRLGKPYMEISPSGNGYRMFALSRQKFANGSSGGNEFFSERRFLTVTGKGGVGTLRDSTAMLGELHGVWFPNEKPLSAPQQTPGMLDHLLHQPSPPEMLEEVAKVRDMLSRLSADCDYDEWRDLIWAIEATGWKCSEDLGREFSKTAPHRFNEAAFQQVRRSFKPGGIGFGTLVFKAKEAGWKETIKQHDATSTATRFELLTRAEINTLPPVQWLIRGALPAHGLAAIYGPSGSGKSFLALDVLIAIAEGSNWFGSKVKQAPVVYVALEGTAGIGQRIQAWEQKHGKQLLNNFRLVRGKFALNSDTDVAELADEIVKAGFAGGVVVIDTLNQAAPEADENSSQDMGRLIRNAEVLQQRICGLVILVHHTGKDTGRGLRGHSSLLAALDATIEVSKTTDSRQWTLAKVKDGADGAAHAFKLEMVPLGPDQDGELVSSCVVVPAPPPPGGTGKKTPQGGHQRSALTIIEGLLRASPDYGQGMAATHAPCIKEPDAIAAVASGLVLTDPKRKRERAATAIRGLINRGLIGCHDGWVWST